MKGRALQRPGLFLQQFYCLTGLRTNPNYLWYLLKVTPPGISEDTEATLGAKPGSDPFSLHLPAAAFSFGGQGGATPTALRGLT